MDSQQIFTKILLSLGMKTLSLHAAARGATGSAPALYSRYAKSLSASIFQTKFQRAA